MDPQKHVYLQEKQKQSMQALWSLLAMVEPFSAVDWQEICLVVVLVVVVVAVAVALAAVAVFTSPRCPPQRVAAVWAVVSPVVALKVALPTWWVTSLHRSTSTQANWPVGRLQRAHLPPFTLQPRGQALRGT